MIIDQKLKKIILSVDGKSSLKTIERETELSYSYVHKTVYYLLKQRILAIKRIGRAKVPRITVKGETYIKRIKQIEKLTK